ncbi:MAG: hypothetical protein COB78_02865 [Hyphomicrobiales bacterium]|nr:MAG: hypothetical protein COB78_02865 [Hyphomicrobiales bacterium]
MVRIVVSGFFLLAGVMPSFAHVGHMGDLAGHSHWLGWGMVVAAGVIVAVLGTKSDDGQVDEEAEEETSVEKPLPKST